MADLERFTLQAGTEDVPIPQTSTGAAQAWMAIANLSARITARLSSMADNYAATQGAQAGAQAGAAAGLPGLDLPAAGAPAPAAGAPAPAVAAPAPARTTSTHVKGRKAQALAYYLKLGYSREQAAGIVGNLQQESAFNPTIAGDGGISIGIGQWNGRRLANLRAFAAQRGTGWADFETQLAFVHHELQTSESGAGRRLSQARSVEQATAAMIGYERPRGWSLQNPAGGHGFANRLAYAREALGIEAGNVNIPAPVPTTAGGPGMAAGMVAHPAAPMSFAVKPFDPLKLTHSFTIRGQAFDEAATRIYANRLESQTLFDLDTIAQQAGGDPVAAEKMLADYRGKVVPQLDPVLRPAYIAFVERHGLGIVRQASQAHEQDMQQQSEASFLAAYTARRKALINLAARAGIDQVGNAAVSAELQGLADFVGGSDGLSPKEKLKLKAELTDDVVSARVLAAFENRKSPQERRAFSQFLGQSYRVNEGLAAAMSPEAFARIEAQMASALAADETARAKQAAAAEKGIDSALVRLKDGIPLPEAERAALAAQVGALDDLGLAETWGLYGQLANWQTANRAQPPEVIAAQAAAYEAKIAREGGGASDKLVLDTMQGLARTAREQVEKDPLGWAEQVGRIKVTPLDLGSPQAFDASLQARAVEAHAVAMSFGRPPVFFRPAEREALAKGFASNPDMIVSFGPALRRALGDRDTPLALAEISKEAPVVAHAAGLAYTTGDEAFLRETAQALKLRQVEGHQPIKMPEALRPPLDALQFLPRTEAAAVANAELVFDLRARAMGLDPGKDQQAATALWADIMSDALGAVERGGAVFGGVAEINGTATLLPPSTTAEAVRDALDTFDAAALARLPPMAQFGDYQVTAEQLSMGHFVAIGLGRYRVALNDPTSADPAWIMAPDGGYWEVPLAAILPQTGGTGW